MLVQYTIDKKSLIMLLKSLNLLEQEDELLYVNNVELRSPNDTNVSILVDRVKNKTHIGRKLSDMTEKELETELMNLLALEKFLNNEFNQLKQQLTEMMRELQSRAVNTSVTEDGIPLDVENRLNQTLEDLLGNKPNQ
ncbi:MAG: hypothetical protein ACK6BZ_07960 [Candidatus Kapaibacterium sp.]|jgi:hypothetical protein|nr:hypothetical protein [Candidatus Kapabacteria bacterium]HRK58824.1 hypothetical protein [Candidatus Kapabacteria bacterium]